MPRYLGAVAASLVALSALAAEPGDPEQGHQVFRACAACHSLAPDWNMTGPTLAGLWGRKAGSLPSFTRYSPALRAADVTWNDQTLDPWLADPWHFIPGNRMTFPGIKDERARADLIAFLKDVTSPGRTPVQAQEAGPGSGMPGMMMGGRPAPNLRKLDPEDRVQSVTYCRDTYRVTTADGQVHEFWERNLRFKTDSSLEGPERSAPAIVRAGMMGDRASVIFSSPDEISAGIKPGC